MTVGPVDLLRRAGLDDGALFLVGDVPGLAVCALCLVGLSQPSPSSAPGATAKPST